MKYSKIMQERYATKMYDSKKRINKEDLIDLQEVLQLAPSSINSQPWHFVFVRDKELKAKLAEFSFHNIQRIKDCDTLVVLQKLSKVATFEKEGKDYVSPLAFDYYEKIVRINGEAYTENWFARQVYIALGVLLSACAAKGIDSTPMEGIDIGGYDKLLKAKKYTTVVAVAMGYRDAEDANQPSKNPKVRLDKDDLISLL